MANKRSSNILIAFAVVAVVLIALRVALPSLVKNYLNEQLAQMGDYRGQIVEVDIALLRSAYIIRGMKITKLNDAVPVPFFAAESIDLSVSWRALLSGNVVANVEFVKPELHFVDGDGADSQSGAGTDWQVALQQLVPIRIDRLGIHNGTLHFHNFKSDPNVHLLLTELDGAFTNLSNADRSSDAIPADFNLQGLLFENAQTSLQGQLDPLGDFRNFVINLKVTGIALQHINDLSEAYGRFNFKSGTGDFIMELEAVDGQLNGYAKPILNNVVIFDLEKDLEEGVFSAAWQAVVGALGQVFRNQPKDRIASQVEISGSLDQKNISVWQTFVSILRNAFVEAYEARFGRE
ncbi:MAG TPA: DUF748 domain-containing protein [Gammaproteobacteria bacterium]|nr:DUF748 domain-containing protein [Gammaproteobacteria bacterium]